MGRRFDTVSFLTDYGLEDEFVGVVKSVIRDLSPHVTVVDLTHGVRPFDVLGGRSQSRSPAAPACWSVPTTGCWRRPSPSSAAPIGPSS
jgi:hypothetical protein